MTDLFEAIPERRDLSHAGRNVDPLSGPAYYLGDSGPRADDAQELADLDLKPARTLDADTYHMSPSAWALWDKCPRAWWYRYVEGVEDRPGRAAVLGTFVHAVMERVLEHPAGERDEGGGWLRDVKNWVWRNELLPHPDWQGLHLTSSEARQFAQDAARAVDHYVAHREAVEPVTGGLAVSEWAIRRTLPGGARFTGRIDLTVELPDGLCLVDYKTGKMPDPGSDYYETDLAKLHQQVLLYVAAVEAEIGRRPDRAVLWFPSDGGLIDAPVERTDEVVGEFCAAFETVTETVRVNPPPSQIEHKPGPLCAWCPAWDRCPLGTVEVLDRLEAGKLVADSPAGRAVAGWPQEPQAVYEGKWGKLQRGRGRVWRVEELRACAEETLAGW